MLNEIGMYVKSLDNIRERRKDNPIYKARVVCECGLEVSQRHLNEHKFTLTHQQRMGFKEEHILLHYDKEKQAQYREARREQQNEANRGHGERKQVIQQPTNKISF